MNKFIGVSLTLLIVASLASAVVIESPASHIADMDEEAAAILIKESFTSGAIVNATTGSILAETSTIAGSPAEIKDIILNIGDFEYFQAKGVVLHGVAYKLYKAHRGDVLVAEDGENGIVVRRSNTGKFVVGVYGKTLSKFEAESRIWDAIFRLDQK